MTTRSQFQAFRFLGVGSDVSPADGLATTAAGGVAMVEGDDSIRQAILLLLSTIPGERLMRPQYGSHLHRLVFAPNDHTTAGLAIHYVRQALRRWEPRLTVLDVDAGPDPDDAGRLDIHLRYQVRSTHAVETLRYSLDIGGSTTTEGGA